MTNVIDIHKPPEFSGWTREVPESETLLNMAMLRPVKVFVMEHIDNGSQMCLAHFEHDGWHNLYHDGHGASHHLFFWMTAWQSDATPEDVALDFFGGQLILSD